MALFAPDNRTKNHENAKLYATIEVAYTVVDFAAAILFVVGSFLFFTEPTTIGTWCFVVGSVCFALKPTLRLGRELMYAKRAKVDSLAERAEGNI